MAEVTVRNVVKRYGAVQVMHGVSVDIEDGQFVVLVGPSGCGKSTLLRMIAGLEAISERRDLDRRPGRQRRDAEGPRHRHGVPVLRALPAQDRRREHGLRAQDQGRAQGRDRREGRPKAASILDLGHLLDRYPKQLSGGQRQRVAMGRAIVRDPAVFLFDEPLSNLDAKLRVAMRVEIKELHQRLEHHDRLRHPRPDRGDDDGRQDRRDARRPRRADRRARSSSTTSPHNIFVAGFIGSPAMNFIKGKLATVDGRTVVQADGGAHAAARRRPRRGRPPRRLRHPPRAYRHRRGRACRRGSRCSSRPARRPRSSPASARTRSTPWSRTASRPGPATRSRSASTRAAPISSTAPAAPASDRNDHGLHRQARHRHRRRQGHRPRHGGHARPPRRHRHRPLALGRGSRRARGRDRLPRHRRRSRRPRGDARRRARGPPRRPPRQQRRHHRARRLPRPARRPHGPALRRQHPRADDRRAGVRPLDRRARRQGRDRQRLVDVVLHRLSRPRRLLRLEGRPRRPRPASWPSSSARWASASTPSTRR